MREEFNAFTKNMNRNSPITLSLCESTKVRERKTVERIGSVWLEENTGRRLSGSLQFSRLFVWLLWTKLELAGEAIEKQSISLWKVRIS